MFDLLGSRPRSAVLLRQATPPDAGAPGSTSARRVLVAVQGGEWAPALVTAWWWPAAGRLAQWRCLVRLAQDTPPAWYYYDPRWVRSLDGWR